VQVLNLIREIVVS